MIGYELPLLDEGSVQFLLLTVMLLVVAAILWFTLAK